MTKTHLTRRFTRAGLAAVFAGAALTVAGGTATAVPINDHGFVEGPSCDPAEGFAKVIGETEGSRFVVCQKNGSFPPDVYYITVNKAKPFPQRNDDVGFGPGTYVITYQGGHKILVGRDYVEIHNGVTGAQDHVPASMYKFDV